MPASAAVTLRWAPLVRYAYFALGLHSYAAWPGCHTMKGVGSSDALIDEAAARRTVVAALVGPGMGLLSSHCDERLASSSSSTMGRLP